MTAGLGYDPVMSFPALDDERYMSLVTFRRSGEEVATPVWFAEANGGLYVGTFPETGKLKRIRANPAVKVAPCNFRGLVTGPYEEATAEVIGDSEEARRALAEKYTWQWRLFGRQISVFLRIHR